MSDNLYPERPSAYAHKALSQAIAHWQEKTPKPKLELVDYLEAYSDERERLMSEWADLPIFSSPANELEAYMDELNTEVMRLLPMAVKALRGEPPAAERSEGR